MIELGLSRVHRLLAKTPLPWRAIHVAGTNGKGSVCAYVSAILRDCKKSDILRSTGHKPLTFGRFTSPHLVDVWDCISLNDSTISRSLYDEVRATVLKCNDEEKIGASEFELLTATAFSIFTRETVDVGIVEVGMGGRLDATNIIGQISEYDDPQRSIDLASFRPKPLATAVTSIALDHQAFLGNTVEAIAAEKAGIFKQGVPAVVGECSQSVTDVIRERAIEADASDLTTVSAATTAWDVWLATGGDPCIRMDTSDAEAKAAITAPIQSRWSNGAVSLQLAWQALQRLGRLDGVPSIEQLKTLSEFAKIPGSTSWSGRLNNISIESVTGYEGPVLLDGAHNAQAARLLAAEARRMSSGANIHWVLAASQGKDVDEILSILLKPGDSVTAVEFGSVEGMPWVSSMSSESIVKKASGVQEGIHRSFGRDLEAALQHASIAAAQSNDLIVIAGSLYLVGDTMRLLQSIKDPRR